jgi:SAM-dependent MidA family methyltransferase
MGSAVAVLLDHVRTALGTAPDEPLDVVDLGAGGAELLGYLAEALPEQVRLHGVDIAPRPPGLPERITWTAQLPDSMVGLLIAHEYLDNLPVDVAEVGSDGGPRLVLVDPQTGDEELGGALDQEDAAWLARWWPLDGAGPGTRAEIGRERDAAWSAAVRCVRRGIAVAVDYDHDRDDRPLSGTLTAYRHGRTVSAVPDGTCDLTAHVALDACAEAGTAAGATATVLIRQADALRALGVDATRPPPTQAREDPLGYLGALAAAGSAAELLDRAGLGGFGWLVQGVGVPLPERLARIGKPSDG